MGVDSLSEHRAWRVGCNGFATSRQAIGIPEPVATQQTLAMLKLLAIGQKQIEPGDHVDGDDFFAENNERDEQEKLR